MAIFRLAWANVLCRLSRSVITLIAMAVAAAVMTAGLSMSQGMAKFAFLDYRVYFEGDIVLFSPGFVGASPLGESGSSITRSLLADSGFNPLLQLYPDFADQGYLAETTWEYRPFTAGHIAELHSIAGVTSVEPFMQMPASVRGREIALRPEPDSYVGYISSGRAPSADGERLEVVLNAYGGTDAKVTDLIDITVPTYSLDSYGIPYVDVTQPATTYTAVVVGLVSFPSRTIHWSTPQGMAQEDGYVHAAELYITPKDWQRIWQHHSGSEMYSPLSLRLRVENMAEVKALAQSLKARFPQFAVFAVPELVDHGFHYGLLDKYYLAPAWTWAGEAMPSDLAAQEDFGPLTSALLLLNAGMLMASQMLAAVASRRNEIGVLKVIGARRREVTTMILVEAAMLALLGSLIGFFTIRLAALSQSVTNGIPMRQIFAETLGEMGLVLGLTVGVALFFGALPAWSISRLTVMEVFRRD